MVRAKDERVASIAGGFAAMPVSWLMGAWTACRSAPLGVGDFRTLLACREMLARRRMPGDGRGAAYGPAELAKLLGVGPTRAGASVRRLEASGLIRWSGSAIEFPELPDEQVEQLVDSIGRGRGSLTIPRRMLRHLARGARPALIATALGVLLRCLSRRKGGWDGRGRLKASWIAGVFGVDVRRVKAARLELVALGWIEPEPDRQRAMNRWGRAYRIDLAWDPAVVDGPGLPPPPAPDRPEIATPSVDPDPLPEREKDQDPAGRGPAGDLLEGQGAGGGPLPAPTLDDVRPEDLRDTGRLLELHRQAVARQFISPCEADRLRFAAAAEHALAIGKGNPPGLFSHLVRNRCWRYITQADEDAARRKLHLHLHRHGERPHVGVERPGATSWSTPGLSDDAQIVREIRAATIRAGIFRDPWPAFQARNPAWKRDRWDAALSELRLA